MNSTHQDGTEQSELWNGVAGRIWVDAQEVLNQMLKPFQHLLVEAVPTDSATRVLDVGCGTGSTTRAVARRVGPDGGCSTGIDISEPMIAAARARAEQDGVAANFIRADAQTYTFERASFDSIISRFGVMFFEDPIAAFANLRRAGADHCVLRFVAWRSAEENPFMTAAERAAAPLLPNLTPRRQDQPGQFGFADNERVGMILDKSGWVGVDIRPIDVACSLPEKELLPYLTRFGPVGMALTEADDQTRAQVGEVVHSAFRPYVKEGEVRYTAACWMVSARAS